MNLEMLELLLSGKYRLEHYRDGKLIDVDEFKNGIVTVGKNYLLDAGFRNQTQITAWYFGLINNSGFSALSAADTMSSHTGWTECTDYDEANRPTWSPGAASSGSITNSTPVDFTMNATVTLYGAFIASVNTKGGTSGTLWSTGAFSTTKPVADNDVVKLVYTLNS